MDKIILALKSRTTWTIIVTFIVTGYGGISGLIPAQYATLIGGLLSLLAIYFKVNPSQNYTTGV